MGNLYIWFASVTERRDFVLRLLGIPELAEQNGTTKKEREKLEDLELHLDLLDAGKTKSPYYNLHKRYYNARIPRYERQTFTQPWDLPVVFMKGLRQLYTQNSYAFRPGKWLVLQFRATKEAAKLYLWEQLAFAFNYYGQIKQAEKCLRIQAGLQPKESDAFLNLGVLLAEGGSMRKP